MLLLKLFQVQQKIEVPPIFPYFSDYESSSYMACIKQQANQYSLVLTLKYFLNAEDKMPTDCLVSLTTTLPIKLFSPTNSHFLAPAIKNVTNVYDIYLDH